MGDINCDFQDGNAEGRAWESALEGAGYTALDQQNGWGKIPTRMPWVPKHGAKKARGTPRHLDVVLASGPAVANLDPLLVQVSRLILNFATPLQQGLQTAKDTKTFGNLANKVCAPYARSLRVTLSAQ